MIVTEKEAAEKWCPHAGHLEWDNNSPIETVAAARQRKPTKGDSCCIGSRCMAWREAEPKIEEAEGSKFSTPQGYCGLAGLP